MTYKSAVFDVTSLTTKVLIGISCLVAFADEDKSFLSVVRAELVRRGIAPKQDCSLSDLVVPAQMQDELYALYEADDMQGQFFEEVLLCGDPHAEFYFKDGFEKGAASAPVWESA